MMMYSIVLSFNRYFLNVRNGKVAGCGVHKLNSRILVAFGINEENVNLSAYGCFRGYCIGFHILVGLLIAEFIQIVIDTQAGIFKVCPFARLDVIPFA